MKKMLLIFVIIGVVFTAYNYIALYKECVVAFRENACIHGIKVDGQWFSSASKMAAYLLFTKGLLFREKEFEYEFHTIKSL